MVLEVAKFPGGGVAMAMYNFDESIRDFARDTALRPRPQDAGLPDQEHDPQGLRRPFQGHLRRGVRGRVQTPPGSPTMTPPHRRPPMKWGGRLRVGVQERRRRRAVRHRRPGLRLARLMTSVLMTPDGQTVEAGGGPRHGHPSLPRAPEGQQDLHQPHRVDLRVDRGLAHRGSSTAPPRSPPSPMRSRRSHRGRRVRGYMTKAIALLIAPDAPWRPLRSSWARRRAPPAGAG